MMALSGQVEWYWPEKVLAICFPALRGRLGRRKCQSVIEVVMLTTLP